MFDALTSFLQRPTAKRFRELAQASAVSNELEQERMLEKIAILAQLSEAEEFEEALRIGRELLPSCFLSLRVHRLLGYAALKLERREGILHRFAFDACMRAIELTGRGTKASPWFVPFASDEYEFLREKGHRVLRQSLVENEGVLCDVLMLENEREAWFHPNGCTTSVPARKPRKRTQPSVAAGRKR